MPNQVTIYNPQGKPQEDLDVTDLVYSWIINEIGDARFSMSINDAKTSLANLQFGNIIYIQHDKLAPWVGFISDDPYGREWNYGNVQVSCVDAKQYFMWRQLPYALYAGNTEQLFKKIVDVTNHGGALKLYEGDILAGGNNYAYDGGMLAYDAVVLLTKVSKTEWSITPDIASDGTLQLYANLYKRKKSGIYQSASLDETNTRNLSRILSERGPIYNSVNFMSHADSAGARYFSPEYKDQNSISKYGLREYTEEGDALTPAGIDEAAQDFLEEHREPHRFAPLTLLDAGTLYTQARLGNQFDWTTSTAGFGQTVGVGAKELIQLASLEYDARANELGATLEIITP